MRSRSGRLAALFALALVLVPSGASGPAATDEGLAAALAPVQTAVDAAGEVVLKALPEADRDGTPDDSARILATLNAFTLPLEEEWALPLNATHRDALTIALPLARGAFHAVEDVPGDVGALARARATCLQKGEPLNEDAFAAALLAQGRLAGVPGLLLELAAGAPPGVDAGALNSSALALREWLDGEGDVRACERETEGTFLTLKAHPVRAWPFARVQFAGTSTAREVHVSAPALGLNATLPVVDNQFGAEVVVPAEVAFGVATVRAHDGEREAYANLTLTPVPTTLRLVGTPTLREGGALTLSVVLSSPVPEVVDGATVEVRGFGETRTLTLQKGQGRVTFDLPPGITAATVRATFTGDDAVSSAFTQFALTVQPALAAKAGGAQGGTRDALREWAPWIATGVLVLALAVAWSRRNQSEDPSALPHDGPTRAITPSGAEPPPPVMGLGLVALFSRVVRLLRGRGLITHDLTAREVGARLEGWRVPAGEVVPAFERARYGGFAEEPSVVERARAWFRTAWARVTGGEAS